MILIKRYPNRKLYNTTTKQYITLNGLADLIREGEEIQVIDHASGDDLTAVTLTQVVLEQEKKQSGLWSSFPLADLIRSGGDHLTALQRGLFSHSFWRQIDEEIRQRVQALVRLGEMSVAEGETLVGKMIAQGITLRERSRNLEPVESLKLEDLEEYLQKNQVPTQDDLERLSQQIDQLAEMIDRKYSPGE
jgi:polyhydroxyalkanoate synthesis repressor PhaR